MKKEYILQSERIFFKHESSENLSCNTYSMHTHNTYELIYFLEGDATHVIEDRKYKLKKGDLILIRPFRYHFIQIDAPAKYERYDILFDREKHGVESVDLIPESMEVINLAGNDIAREIFRKCDLYRGRCDAETFGKILAHLLSELFYNISMMPQSPQEGSESVSPLISRVLRYINENLCTVGEIKEIANHFFISESYLFRLFRAELHQTPKKYIQDKRLLLAQRMLLSGKKPSVVCEECGFGDYTSFYRNYHSFFGHPPSHEGGGE